MGGNAPAAHLIAREWAYSRDMTDRWHRSRRCRARQEHFAAGGSGEPRGPQLCLL